jgi:hypothetical protein
METNFGAGEQLVEQLQADLRELRAELETLRAAVVRQVPSLSIASDEPWMSLPPWHATAA